LATTSDRSLRQHLRDGGQRDVVVAALGAGTGEA